MLYTSPIGNGYVDKTEHQEIANRAEQVRVLWGDQLVVSNKEVR